MAPPDPRAGVPPSERREGLGLASRAILWVGLGTGAALLLSLAGLWFFFQAVAGDPRTGFAPPARFPPPALQSDPAGELRAFRAAQRAQLEGYAWVDRERGLVRVPIERAMALLVARGTEAAYAPLEAPPEPAAAMQR